MRVTSHEPRATNKGLTLMEQTVVIASIALLVSFGLPAIRAFLDSFETRSGARTMISGVLASARAIAAKEQHYAGVRFQKAYHPEGLLKAPQYMIFIVHDFDKTGLAPGFRAVEGIEPIKLPDSVGVMDLRINYDDKLDTNGEIINDDDLIDTTAFSIIFSPSGKLVIHDVQVRNRDGIYRPNINQSKDDIFNSKENVEDYDQGMFIQDDYGPSLGLYKESSRNRFIIYDRTVFEKVDKNRRYSDYLRDLDVIYINPYTGTMIRR